MPEKLDTKSFHTYRYHENNDNLNIRDYLHTLFWLVAVRFLCQFHVTVNHSQMANQTSLLKSIQVIMTIDTWTFI